MKISVSSYSFYNKIKSGEMTLEDCIIKAKEMGFEAIEICDFNLDGETVEDKKESAKKMRTVAEKTGIAINAYIVNQSIYRNDAVEFMRGQLDIAKELGAPMMRHDVCRILKKTGEMKSFDLMLPTLAKATRATAEYGAELGIRTCSENHGQLSQDSERMERLFNAVNHDNYGLLIDMGNFMVISEDPAAAFSRLVPYAIHIHVKDVKLRDKAYRGFRWISRGGQFGLAKVVGTGDVPIERCLRALLKAGYDGYLAIENEVQGDCIKNTAKSLKNLKKLLARAEAQVTRAKTQLK